MGACATKPKAEAGDAPVPEPEKEEATGIVSEKKEVFVEEELKKVDGDHKDKEIVVDDDKRRSLGNLFEKEGKDSTEEDVTPLDPVKQEDLSVNEKPTEGSDEINPSESCKTETPVEQTPREVIEPKEVIETVDFAPTPVVSTEEATEIPVEQTPKEVIETVDVAPTPVVSTEEAISSPVDIETQEPEEKQIVEDIPAAKGGQKSETPEGNEEVEEKTTLMAQKPETAVEGKTTEGS